LLYKLSDVLVNGCGDIDLSQIARKKNQPGKRKTFYNEIQAEDRYHHISNFTTSA